MKAFWFLLWLTEFGIPELLCFAYLSVSVCLFVCLSVSVCVISLSSDHFKMAVMRSEKTIDATYHLLVVPPFSQCNLCLSTSPPLSLRSSVSLSVYLQEADYEAFKGFITDKIQNHKRLKRTLFIMIKHKTQHRNNK